MATFFPMFIKIFLFAISVFVVAKIFPGIKIKNFAAAVGVAIVYAVFNYIAYHIFAVFSYGFGALTLGIGFWIINTILLVLTDKVIDSFQINGLFWAAIASLGISVINSLLIYIVMPHMPAFQTIIGV